MRVTDVKLRLFLIGSVLLLSVACGGPAGDDGTPDASADSPPELTDEMIRERLNGVRVRDIPEENGSAEPIGWRFFDSEPKEIKVVDKQVNGSQATVVLEIRTTSSPRSRDQRYLSGQIRTEWVLRRGLLLRQWEIVDTENLTMKYKNLPPRHEQNLGSPTPD